MNLETIRSRSLITRGSSFVLNIFAVIDMYVAFVQATVTFLFFSRF